MTCRTFTALLLAFLIPLQLPLMAAGWAQQEEGPRPSKLRLEIVEGNGAINNIKDRVAREPVVRVEDENRKPVAGAVVVFTLPQNGASGAFTDGSRILTILTDSNGQAAARGLQPNTVAGKMQIRVNASFRGVTASKTIMQTNSLVVAAGGGAAAGGAAAGAAIGTAKIIAIVAAVGGAAAAGVAVAATKGGSSNPTPSGPPPSVITPGTPTVGPPR
ncbi:MAG: hypothetical protein SFV51_10025 [Bryobacteraceae bacterium]|nr:hypothetical protein [Bryobacteraceae bacterium]